MIHGIINIYKEKGFTSHDVVAKLRGITGQRKIGHTGTLDPDATGVLPVCLGKATKLCNLLTDKDKTYETVLLLGKTTDTQDASGAVLEEQTTDYLIEEAVQECIRGFIGSYDQLPPMYSAIKIGGKKLYELAREGKEIERKARTVTIHDIQVREIDLPRVKMEVSCSKGTYIRTLCHDVGHRLGCGGCMEELIRTRVGCFTLNDSISLAEAEKLKANGTLQEIIIPIDAMFETYQRIVLSGEAQRLAYNGNTFTIPGGSDHYDDDEYVRVYNSDGRFIAIYSYSDEKKNFQIVKMFCDSNEMT